MYIAFWQKKEPVSGYRTDYWQVTDTMDGALSVLADINCKELINCYGVGKIEHASEPHWLEVNENWGIDK